MTREQETIRDLIERLEAIATVAEELVHVPTPHDVEAARVFGDTCGRVLSEVISAQVAVEAARREFGK